MNYNDQPGSREKFLDLALTDERAEAGTSASINAEEVQNMRILHRSSNFFVVSPRAQKDQSTPGTAHKSIADSTDEYAPPCQKHAITVRTDIQQISARSRLSLIPARVRKGVSKIRHVPDATEALLLPDTQADSRANKWKVPGWLEAILLTITLAGTFTAHAINMFNYPHYEQDEGTYMMYAWAVAHGSIDPYPYGYGHPPLAWIQIAFWTKLIGGFSTFGNAINTGRVLMLFCAIGSTLLVYRIARVLGVGLGACLLAALIFALSPLSITFQREVLLDNFATFWCLLSLYLIVASKSRLSYTLSAAFCFGVALLSKEVLLILFPAMVYAVRLYTTRFQRTFGLSAFSYSVIAIGSTFVLMAVLKGELFPYEWHLPWDYHPHLSLIDTYITQVSRGQGGGSLKDSWDSWTKGDPLLIIFSIAGPVFNFIVGWRNRKHLLLSLLALSFWVLLVRGGVIFAFYIIPLIPLIAINISLALNTFTRWIGRLARFELLGTLLIFGTLMALIPYDIQHSLSPYNLFTQRPALVENEALVWIRTHVSSRAVIVINSNLFTDLHEPGTEGVGNGAPYPYAHVYWFAALDPSVHDAVLEGNWDRIDYIVADSVMLRDIQTYGGGMDLIKAALDHSVLRKEFTGDNYEYVRIYQVIHVIPPPEA